MVERFKNTSRPIFKSISALSRGILKRENGRDTIHFNADASNTELLFRIIHSENQLSIYEAITNWCEQFRMTEEEREKKKESVTKGVLSSVNSYEVKLLVSPPKLVPGNSFAGKHPGLQIADRDYSIQKGLRTCIVPAPGISWDELQTLDLTRTTVLGRSFHYAENFTRSRLNPHSRAFAAIPGGTIIGPVIEVQIVKILDQYGLETAFPSPNDKRRTSYIMIPQERVGSWMKFTFPKCRTQIQCRITH